MISPRTTHPTELGLPPGDLWIFGYGSLMWDPGFPYVNWAPALVYGYHRALCIYSNRWRGTADRPGLVLGLDRGGACHGIAFRVAVADVETALEGLWAREMSRRVYQPRMMRARLPDKEVRALTFIADRRHPGYAGKLSTEQTASTVATCCGTRGSNIEYLTRTLDHLAELGVSDHNLLRVLAAVRALPAQGAD
ncbi:MAG: gamma-glutamylcyclotransferase [Betaproteobacteria bacterium]|nr:gamma-glutamylcyclotransferase [Betaproteobacteria bacterium]